MRARTTSRFAKPAPPAGRASLQQWVQRSEPLRALRGRAADSRAMWDALGAVVPPALASGVHPGSLDGDAWTLSASSSAVAAKLKLVLPLLLRRLRQEGWAVQRIAIRVTPPLPAQATPAPTRVLASRAPDAVRERLRELRRRREADTDPPD